MSGAFIALDTNLLVYAFDRSSPWHQRARECVRMLAEGGQPWAIPWPCVHEFLAVATNPQLYRQPSSMAHALGQVEAWAASPTLRWLAEMEGHWDELKRLLLRGQFSGGSVHDARIAALCREHGVSELWSADRDFSRASGLRVRNPLVA